MFTNIEREIQYEMLKRWRGKTFSTKELKEKIPFISKTTSLLDCWFEKHLYWKCDVSYNAYWYIDPTTFNCASDEYRE